MINYSFCNLKFSISDVPFVKDVKYDVFRDINTFSNADSIIETQFVQELNVPKRPLVYQSLHGLKVIQDGDKEYRYFNNYFTGEIDRVLIDDGKQKTLQISDNHKNVLMNELTFINHLGFEKTMSEYGRFVLHSSFIKTAKGAVLFTAPSGTGKSTQADLWYKYRGVEIINGDRAGIWKEKGEWLAGGVPWCGTSEIMKNEICPLRAIVILEQGPVNIIIRLSIISKIKYLMEQITINPWNQKMLTDSQMFCTLLSQEIPIIFLSCRPDKGAVEVLEKELEAVKI